MFTFNYEEEKKERKMEIPMDYIFQKPKINPDHIPGRKDLIQFFNRKKLQQYVEMFPKTVNFAFFKTMGEDDFSEYGILPESNDMQVLLKAVNDAQLEEEAEDQKVIIYYVILFLSQLGLQWWGSDFFNSLDGVLSQVLLKVVSMFTKIYLIGFKLSQFLTS